MPEYGEVIANAYTIQRWLRVILPQRNGEPLPILRVWADATQPEQDCARASPSQATQKQRLANGLVYILDSKSKIRRGTQNAQEYVYPHVGGQPLPSFNGIRLKRVYTTPRTVVLDLDELSLQVRLQTHTVTQVYTREQWYSELAPVPSKVRKFRVGMALEMDEFVVAFLTLDNLFTPYWFKTSANPPVRHADVYLEWGNFLGEMATHVRMEAAKGFRSEDYAINFVRKKVGGVGIYMSEELFFLSGVSPFITLGEFLGCPSRVARFCEAFWVLAQRAHCLLTQLMEPCYHGYVLAPTTNQRMRYVRWLYVHAKKQVMVSERMKFMWNEYQNALRKMTQMAASPFASELYCNIDAGFYDVFEPTYIRSALAKDRNLGHLVFGNEAWAALASRWGLSYSGPPMDNSNKLAPALDPLTSLYSSLGLLGSSNARSNLRLSRYHIFGGGLFLQDKEMCSARLSISFYQCHTVTTQKSIWTVMHPLPHLASPVPVASKHRGAVQSRLPGAKTPKMLPPPAKKAKKTRVWTVDVNAQISNTFEHVVQNTNGVAIGPLEYCATAYQISLGRSGRKNTRLAICKESPAIPQTLIRRLAAKFNRVAQGRHKATAPKITHKKASLRGGWPAKSNHAPILATPRPSTDNTTPHPSTDNAEGSATSKRHRVSVDKALLEESRGRAYSHQRQLRSATRATPCSSLLE
ncbi:hypothetical protein ONZ51_g10587 [Trametes cubensis]|uniref:Uncharacterized protein n=1 Tax=Trametes cubensis TaxID=1111947 RepID=A0AAD7X4Q8_9APHY|nr:hypothetical protein ONZ51_g10587 [Trametes cubensis]